LRWKFQPGQEFQQTIVQDTKLTTVAAGQNIDTTIVQTMDLAWKVGEVGDQGIADVAQELTRIRFKMSNVAMNLEFDSNSDRELTGQEALLAGAFKTMANAKFQTKINPRGQVVEAAVSQETLNRLKSAPNLGQLGNMVSEEALVGIVKQTMVAFPEDAIEVGATWTDSLEMQMPQFGKVTSNSNLTYAGPTELEGKTLERINMQLTSNLVPDASAMAKINMKDQTASGVLYFDNAAGRVSHSELVQDMTLAMQVLGQNVEMEVNQTITSRLAPAGPEKAPESKKRTWTDASGTYTVVAEFVSVADGNLTLKKESGELIEVPLSRLSDQDQAYVRERSAP